MDMILDTGVNIDLKSPLKNKNRSDNVPISQKKLLKELKATLEILDGGVAQKMKPLVRKALEIANEMDSISFGVEVDKENLHPNAARRASISPTSKGSFASNAATLDRKKASSKPSNKSTGLVIFQDDGDPKVKSSTNKRTTRRSNANKKAEPSPVDIIVIDKVEESTTKFLGTISTDTASQADCTSPSEWEGSSNARSRDSTSPSEWEGSSNAYSSSSGSIGSESPPLSSLQWRSPVVHDSASIEEEPTFESKSASSRRLSTESSCSALSLASDAETVALRPSDASSLAAMSLTQGHRHRSVW
jgi:hypothetical protein